MEAAFCAAIRSRRSLLKWLRSRWIINRSQSDAAAAAEECESSQGSNGSWKWEIRKRVWDFLETEGVCPVARYRFPSFPGAEIAADKVVELPEFLAANCVSINTDTPQRPMRSMTLREMKKILIPCLPTGFFRMLDPVGLSDHQIKEAANKTDYRTLGKPLSFSDQLRVDVLIVGSVAVDPMTGARLGKGEGLADLEYALLRYMGAVDDSTLIVTTVHDKQLMEDIPTEKMLPYDVPVDVICTPTETIYTKSTVPKPTGVYWDKLSPEVVDQMQPLKDLRRKIKDETGELVKLAPSQQRRRIGRHTDSEPGIFICELNPSTTEVELKEHLRELGVEADNVVVYKTATWKLVARVSVPDGIELGTCVDAINNTELKGWCMKAREDSETVTQ